MTKMSTTNDTTNVETHQDTNKLALDANKRQRSEIDDDNFEDNDMDTNQQNEEKSRVNLKKQTHKKALQLQNAQQESTWQT